MNRWLALLVAFLMVGWMFAVAPVGAGGAQTDVTLTVEVVDGGGVAIGGVDITATWENGSATATTASNGRAFVDVPEDADVELTIDHENFVRNSPYIVENATEREVTVPVSLKGQATVTVVDADGEPLENATVELRRGDTTVVEGETAENGTFRSGVVEQGNYRISAVKPGYLRESMRDRVGVDSEHDFELERGTVRMEITVVDDHFEEPTVLEGARVRLTDADGEVATVRASGGTASLDVEVNNRYTVTVLRDGYLETSRSVGIGERNRAVEVATQRVPTLTVEPQNSRVVVGETTRLRVINAYDEPVEGAEIRHDNGTVGETDAAGELSVSIDAAGEQRFRAIDGDVESDPVVIEGVEPGDEETPTETPTPTETEETPAPDDQPGFGAAVALFALLGAALLARRR